MGKYKGGEGGFMSPDIHIRDFLTRNNKVLCLLEVGAIGDLGCRDLGDHRVLRHRGASPAHFLFRGSEHQHCFLLDMIFTYQFQYKI